MQHQHNLQADQVTREIEAIIPPNRGVLYVHEVASLVCVTPHHIADLIAEGQIQAQLISKGKRNSWLIRVEDLRRWLTRMHTGFIP
jgi:hypothetical protein